MKLRTEKVIKKYRQRTVVKSVSVEVEQGEIVGLLGPNGAGKTTTFYMMVGIIKPNGGRVFLDDSDITELPMYKRAQRGVGYLAQEASVFRRMTVSDNIMSVLQFRKDLDKDGREQRLEELISEFHLSNIRDSKGIQLSGGERRRTEIARALANNPKFLLLDEPFAGVDPIAVQDIQDIVAHLKRQNIGILITDHNVNETLRITDRAYLLYEGSVLHHGTPEDMANDPDVREKYLGRDFHWHGRKQTAEL
ncbi:MAG: LPS export ABC transporter ATP-binding protein [Bacteroidales bacterium]|nr:LPS export ABC transporter ATP-binding protein [Bacteroidales bacterium]MCR5193533.1 LPS export ABC transporter ATP-binding protein [Bacteroidales bacterium]